MKIKGFMIKKGIQCLKDYGPRELLVRVIERQKRREIPYDAWYQSQKISGEEWERQRSQSAKWAERPMVSICVPLYKTPEKFLCEMIDSVRNQTYENWQLCLADGSPDMQLEQVIKEHYPCESRICYKHLDENLGIADNTNAAFALAEGEWIGLLDHDDILAPEALFESLSAIMAGNNVEAVYSDEDKITEDLVRHFDPHFKPDYNLDLLRSNNYITHFFVVKKEIVEQVGGFCKDYDGSQDYDFILRCTTKAKETAHVPRILYHWRTSENSTAENPASKMYAFEAGKRAIETHLQKEGIAAEVLYTKGLGFYRVKYQLKDNPLVSVLVVGGSARKSECEKSLEKSSYKNFEVLHVEENVQSVRNSIEKEAKGEYILLLNQQAEVLDADCIEELLSHCQQEKIAAIGPKMIDGKKKVRSAGRILGGEKIVNDVYVGLPSHYYGYMHRASTQIAYSALATTCVMIKKAACEEVGGLDAQFADFEWAMLDLFQKFNEAGYRNVYTPYAEVCDNRAANKKTKEQQAAGAAMSVKERTDEERLLSRWERLKTADANYNPNLSVEKADYTLKV